MEKILKERNIEWLFHFTRVENLNSILENGIIPRSKLREDNINSVFNDEYRFDKCENANCLSVEFPNYKMFYLLRQNNPETDWVILGVDANIIKNFKCAFCYTNAGSSEMFKQPLENKLGVKAFRGIFNERAGYPNRNSLNIPEYYPTNPQAEVLVFKTIPVSYIKHILFNSNNILNQYKNKIPSHINCEVNENYFYPRKDYVYWR